MAVINQSRSLDNLLPMLLLQTTYILDDHDEERKLDSQSFLWIQWASDVVGGDVGAHDFEDGRLNVWISDSLDVTVANVLVPNLKRLGSDSK